MSATTEIYVGAGEHIDRACERLVRAAPAFMTFNDVRIAAEPGATVSDLVAYFHGEMDRRRREYEASDAGRKQQADAEIANAEARRLQEETRRTVAASGVREKCPWTADMGEISGFGGGYEEACRDMVYAGLAWLATKPDADLSSSATDDAKALDRIVLAACPDCSGAMHGAAMSACAYIARNGWAKYVAAMTQRAARHG